MSKELPATEAAALAGCQPQEVFAVRVRGDTVTVVTTDGRKLVGMRPPASLNTTPSAANPDVPGPESQSAGAPSGAPAAPGAKSPARAKRVVK